jgi:uncharacterized protein involved in outer membrane biogenesis
VPFVKRVVVGLAGLVLAVLTLVLVAGFVVPWFLPKDTIRAELVAQIESRTGLRLRLDGPVGLSLLPGLGLDAENVGIASAQGEEMLRVEAVDFGLAWSTLFGGAARLTHITLEGPVVTLGRRGKDPVQQAGSAPSSPGFPADRWSAATEAITESNADGADAGTSAAMLARIGVDRLTVRGGRILQADGTPVLEGIDLDISLPSLTGAMDLEGQVVRQGVELEIAGTIAAPLALADGGSSELDLSVSGADAELRVTGTASLAGPGSLRVSAGGETLAGTLQAFGASIPRDPGAFSMTADLATTPRRIGVDTLTATLGPSSLRGSGSADISGDVPSVSGEVELGGVPLADVLAIAGRSEQASGTLGGSLRFAGRGEDAAALLAGADLSGRLTLAGGEVSGLAVPGKLGEEEGGRRIRDLALAVDFAGLDAPVSLSGGLTWRDEAFRIEGSLTPALLAAGMPAPTRVRLASRRVTLGYDGAFSTSGGLDGDVVIETADLRGLASWLGSPMSSGGGLKRFSFSGKLSAGEDAVSFSNASILLDDTRGEGEGTLSFAGKPKLTARLALERLGLDPYLDAAAPSSDVSEAPRVPGVETRGWSRAPIDLSGLSAIDADLSLSARAIAFDAVEIGPSRLDVTIAGGKLTADLGELTLYGGTGQGRLVVDGGGAVPELSGSFRIGSVNAHPFLSALADFGWLQGKLALESDLVARGTSMFEIVSSLAGTARFDFADGAVRGINIPRMVRGLTVDTLLGWSENPEQKTDFSALGAGFEIARGIATSEDLALVGPLVRMTGAGRIDMPEKLLDWRLEPRVVATLDGAPPVPLGKGESRELQGLGVPVIVRGPWDRPQIYPDLKGILENPQAALKQLEGLGGGLVQSLGAARDQAGNGSIEDTLSGVANDAIKRATGGNTRIDVEKVIQGEVDDEQVLEAVEQGFGLPQGFLGSFGLGGGQRQQQQPQQQQDAPQQSP